MPSYSYYIEGAQPADDLDTMLDSLPQWVEMISAPDMWPELVGTRVFVGACPGGGIPVIIQDTITDEEALAYHTRSTFGAVSCVVERQMVLRYQEPLSAALLHEVVESGLDPELSTTVVNIPTFGELLLEVCDPVTSSYAWINGVAFPNITSPRYWLRSNTGRLDLLGVCQGPLPLIPKVGAIQKMDGTLQYGDLITPAKKEYLEQKRGRRWFHRQRAVGSIPQS